MPIDKSANRRRPRRAMAAVELAVCLPVIVLLVFATIESCTMIFVTQGLHAATYEGARLAIQKTADTTQAIERAQMILDGHGIAGATIHCEPADVTTAAPGELVAVVVSAPCSANRISPVFFFGSQNLEVRTTMAKE
jgi:hypothetical protein